MRFLVGAVIIGIVVFAFGLAPGLSRPVRAAGSWPPGGSPDMTLVDSGQFADWGTLTARYAVYKYTYNSPSNGYKYIGVMQADWKVGSPFGLTYLFFGIDVELGDGNLAPGGTWTTGNDPYGWLSHQWTNVGVQNVRQ